MQPAHRIVLDVIASLELACRLKHTPLLHDLLESSRDALEEALLHMNPPLPPSPPSESVGKQARRGYRVWKPTSKCEPNSTKSPPNQEEAQLNAE